MCITDIPQLLRPSNFLAASHFPNCTLGQLQNSTSAVRRVGVQIYPFLAIMFPSPPAADETVNAIWNEQI